MAGLNLTDLSEHAMYQDTYTTFWTEQTYAFLSTAIGYSAVFGNGYVLMVMISAVMRRGVKPIDLLYLQLVLADILISLNLIYAGSVLSRGRFLFPSLALAYGERGLCAFMGLLGTVGGTFALFSVTGLMLCVVMAVQYPIIYQQKVSVSSVVLYMVLTGCYNMVQVIFPFIAGEGDTYGSVNGECLMSLDDWLYVKGTGSVTRFFISLVLEWLPVLALVFIVTVCGVVTFIGLSSRGRAAKYREVAVNMMLISLSYFFLNLPANIIIIIDMIDKNFWDGLGSGVQDYVVIVNFVAIMELTRRSTVLTNPLIFHLRRTQFVDDARDLLAVGNSNVELGNTKVNVLSAQTEVSNYDTFTSGPVD